MAWSLVQQSAAQTTTGVNTLPGNSTAGNLLVAVVASASNTALTAPSGWVTGPNLVNGAPNELYLFYYPNNPGGLSSFTFSGGTGTNHVVVGEFTCPNAGQVTGTSDTGTNTAGAVASVAVTTGGTAQAGDLVICGGFEHLNASSAITWTDPGGFSEFTGLKVTSLANHCYAAYELAAGSAGAQSATVTSSVASTLTTGWTGALATFSQPALPAPARVVRPIRPVPPARGRVYRNTGAPVRNPGHGPPVYPLLGPVRSSLPPLQPRAGRASGNAGNPVTSPVPVPALRQPVRARVPMRPAGGRIASRPGAPVRNPVPGPVFRQAAQPAQARQPLPPRGRASGTLAAPPPVPPVTLANTFETGLAAGTAVTGGNSGQGQAGTAFDSVSTTNGTVAYDTANIIHGGLDCKIQATSSGANFASWIHALGTQQQVWFRLYCYLGALPGSNLWLFSALQGSALCTRFGITPAGQVLIQNSAQTSVATSFSRVSAGTGNWFRLEGYVSAATGAVTAQLFTTADSPVPVEVIGAAGTSTTGVIDRVRFGITASAGALGPLWLDDVAATNVGWLGPSSAVAAPSRGFPAQARVPALTPRGRGQVSSAAGVPPVSQQAPAPFAQATQAVQARHPLPARGRAGAGGQGAPVVNPAHAVLAPRQGQPARTRPGLPPRGRVIAGPGAPLRNPGTGPPVPQQRRAVQARPARPPGGRATGSRVAQSAPPAAGAAVPQLRRPVQARVPRTYRGPAGHGNPGAPVRNPRAAAAFPAPHGPMAARLPLPMAGRTASNDGGPVVNPLPPFPVYSPTGFAGANILTGPPASVLAEVLRSLGGTGGRQRATFTTTQYTTAYPDLPSVITQVVWLC